MLVESMSCLQLPRRLRLFREFLEIHQAPISEATYQSGVIPGNWTGVDARLMRRGHVRAFEPSRVRRGRRVRRSGCPRLFTAVLRIRSYTVAGEDVKSFE
jgi:hypothetical protein